MQIRTAAERRKSRLASRQHEMQTWGRKPLKAFTNILRVSLDRRLRKIEVRGFPFVLYYEPATLCNLKCPSCPTGTGLLERPKELVNPEVFKKTIDALADWVFILSMYNWGEPLLHKDFATLVRYAADKGIIVTASSNFSMPLTARQCEEIVKSGLHSLKVGIDGASPAVHALYRRGSNLDQLHKNLRTLILAREALKSATPIISVSYHVFAHNETEIEEFSKQMSEMGVDTYSAVPAWLPPDGTVSAPKDPQYNMYKAVNASISKLRSKGKNLRPCTWLYYASIINPGGTISPCCGVVSESSDFGKLDALNGSAGISEQFGEQWNGRKYASARELFGGRAEVERWAAKNLRDLDVDGMAFSGKGASMICAQCPIPQTLEQWSRQILRIYRRLCRLTWQCLGSLDLGGAVANATKALILRMALWLQ